MKPTNELTGTAASRLRNELSLTTAPEDNLAKDIAIVLDALDTGTIKIELNKDTRKIFGSAPYAIYAHALRKQGHEIGTSYEDEQAYVTWFLLNHYLAAPDAWRDNATKEIWPNSEPACKL